MVTKLYNNLINIKNINFIWNLIDYILFCKAIEIRNKKEINFQIRKSKMCRFASRITLGIGFIVFRKYYYLWLYNLGKNKLILQYDKKKHLILYYIILYLLLGYS